MTSILLVEDDEHKRERVLNYILSLGMSADIITAHSVQSAIQRLHDATPHLLVLDMSLPVFDYNAGEHEFQHLPFGGRDVLEYVDSHYPDIPVIVLTALESFSSNAVEVTLDELSDQFFAEFPKQFVGSVWYSALEDRWQGELSALIAKHLRRDV